jgi:hypothetical protein
MNNQKVKRNLHLIELAPGDFFEFVGLEDLYRNLSIIRVSQYSAEIKGIEILQKEKEGQKEISRPLARNYTVSPMSEVRRVDEKSRETKE